MTVLEPNFSPDHSLTPQQHRVINMLADGQTISEAAAAINVHRNTIRNWRRRVPEFAHELDLAIREQALHWHEQVVILAPKAIEILCTILHNEQSTLSQKLRAATTILKMATEPKTPLHKQAQPALSALQALPGELLTIKHEIAQRRFQPGRNATCPCNSGLKFKRCCAGKPEMQQAAFTP